MERQKQTTTVYKKTTQVLPDSILDCRKVFSSLLIEKYALQISRHSKLNDLLNSDCKWLEFVKFRNSEIESELNTHFTTLTAWLVSFKDSPSQINQSITFSYCDNLINTCYILILSILMLRQGSPFSQSVKFATQVYKNYKKTSFSTLVCMGKREFFSKCLQNETILFKDFISELNKHLFVFTNHGISPIFAQEIKKKLLINEDLPCSKLKEFFELSFGTLDCFRRFINRNFLYRLIEEALEQNAVLYELLPMNQNHSLRYKIVITNTSFPNYRDREYLIDYTGVLNSPRYISDHLITFGKNAEDEFTNDICLPNMNDVDSVFAVMFINVIGLGLIDISANSTVKMKIPPNGRKELSDGLVIVLGRKIQFSVHFIDGVSIDGMGKVLKLVSFGDCEITKTIDQQFIFMNSEFSIGRSEKASFRIVSEEVDEIHAVVFGEEGKFFVRDNESSSGTYYRLKKREQIESGEPSEFIKVKHLQVFQVKSFEFIAIDRNAL